MITGDRLYQRKPKLYRLTQKGRTYVEEESTRCGEFLRLPQQVPLSTPKINHYLAIGDVYLDLMGMGGLLYFLPETRDNFTDAITGHEKKYCPDAFFVWREKVYILEVQLSACSSKEWMAKWALAWEFFSQGHHKRASWQIADGNTITPHHFVVVSNQHPETVTAGGERLPILPVRHIRELGE